ncbi:MAG: pyridoxamine 5'-phosphate oxidase family protein [Planctomycetota bacterium]
MSDTPRERFQEVLESFSTAMLVTEEPNGSLRGRPMRVAGADSDADLWFITRVESGKSTDIEHESQVAVTCQGGGKFLTISGRARLCEDAEMKAKVDELWSETWKVWFPGGKDDPSLGLLHIEADKGEYWDNSGTKGLQYAIRAGQAYWQGEAVEATEEMNAQVAL